MRTNGVVSRRVWAFASATVAAFALMSAFQNCSSLDSPTSSGGGGNFSSYAAGVAVSDVSVSPGQVANVVVVLDKALANSVLVSYKTFDDSAGAGVHYQAVDSSIDLAPGQTNFQIAINTLATAGTDFAGKRFRVQVTFAGNVAPESSAYVSFTSGGMGALANIQRSSNVGLLSAGQFHTCATKNDALYCWGYNAQGQLGVGNAANRSTPGLVASMDSGVSAVAAGRLFTCAIKQGALYCWGHNGNYQLGDGTMGNATFPKMVFDMGSGVQAVSAGYSHACAIKSGGLYCWGDNTYAQTGHNNGTTQQVPLAVQNFTTGVTAVAAGTHHTCAVRNGGLYCWGFNQYGELGIGNTVTSNARNPVSGLTPITGFESGVIAVSATGYTTCATKGNGALYCWGYNGNGQLGLGNTANSSAPNLINGFDMGVQHIVSATLNTCAIKTSGLHCWGYNGYGQLGNNTSVQLTAPSANPISVTLNTGESFVHVAGGGHADTGNGQSHSCARTNQNRVFCWGYNGYSQVGDNTAANKLIPTLVGL